MRRANNADRRGRTVLLVVSVEDQQFVDRLGNDGIDLIIFAVFGKHHLEEVLRVTERGVRLVVVKALAFAVDTSSDHRKLTNEAENGGSLLSIGTVRIEGFWVETMQCIDGGGKHAHWVGTFRVSIQDSIDAGRQGCFSFDTVNHRGQLVTSWQLSVDQEISHFKEGSFVGQILDRITTVTQDALLTIQKGNSATARTGIFEPWVKGDVIGLSTQFLNIDTALILSTNYNWQLVGFTPNLDVYSLVKLSNLGHLFLIGFISEWICVSNVQIY